MEQKHLLMLTSKKLTWIPRLLTGRWSHLRREGRWLQLHWELHRLRQSSWAQRWVIHPQRRPKVKGNAVFWAQTNPPQQKKIQDNTELQEV